MEKRYNIIDIISIIMSMVALFVSIFTYQNSKEKDQRELKANTKVVMCQIGQLIHSGNLGGDSVKKNLEYLESQFQILQHMDIAQLKDVDDDLLGYVINVKSFFQQTIDLFKKDYLTVSERDQTGKYLNKKFDELLKQFEILKKKMEIKYSIVIEC